MIESLEQRRLLFAGQPDPLFHGGFVGDQMLGAATGVVVQSTGKIVAEGVVNATGHVVLRRYNIDGTLDTTFGSAGTADLSSLTLSAGPLALSFGDKIVTGGGKNVIRLSANGSPDTTFNSTGEVATLGVVNSIAVDSAENVYVAEAYSGSLGPGMSIPAGAMLQQFGRNGALSWHTSPSVGDTYNDVIANGSRIDVVGSTRNPFTGFKGILRQFNGGNGTVDNTVTFVTPPQLANATSGQYNAVDSYSDGSLALVGTSDVSGGPFVARIATSGQTAFLAPITISAAFDTPTSKYATDVKFQSDGKILAAGMSPYGDGSAFYVARYLPSGQSDPTFGNAGVTSFAAGSFVNKLSQMALAPDGSIAAAGGDPSVMLIEKFLGDAAPLPGRIQAEDFDTGGEGVGYHDTDTINQGNSSYRSNTGVDIQTSNGQGGLNVGWTHAGEWLSYTVNVAATGSYDFLASVADAAAGGTFQLEVDGTDVTGPLAVPDTGSWQQYVNVVKNRISLTAGRHLLRLVMDTNGPNGFVGNFDYFQFSTVVPFLGTPVVAGNSIEAENFDNGVEGAAYHDTESANLGGAYRNTGVDIEPTGDTGGGFDVGWTHPGEFLEYSIHVNTSGQYNLLSRVAAVSGGGSFHLEFLGGSNVTGSISVPDTGGWQIYQTVSSGNFTLGPGDYIMRVVIDTASLATGFAGNFNWFKLNLVSPIVPGNEISGAVFNDLNGNGRRDNGEPGVSGREVYLDLQGINRLVAGDPTAMTDANGSYSFHGLPTPANYIVRLLAQSGWTLTSPNPVYGGFYWIPFVAGQISPGVEFGVLHT